MTKVDKFSKQLTGEPGILDVINQIMKPEQDVLPAINRIDILPVYIDFLVHVVDFS